MVGIIVSLTLCALFPITGPGAVINRFCCLLASIGLLTSSISWYVIDRNLNVGTDFGNGAKKLEIVLMTVAILYLFLTFKTAQHYGSKASSNQ